MHRTHVTEVIQSLDNGCSPVSVLRFLKRLREAIGSLQVSCHVLNRKALQAMQLAYIMNGVAEVFGPGSHALVLDDTHGSLIVDGQYCGCC